ncbi:MAG TPA: TIGR03435 family protein [Bryobacteraceae bacterium]|nr:TIGR03435 family protein [Bryobacteraceae bacterium]
MISKPASIVLIALAYGSAFGQTAQTPPTDTAARFEIADVHVTPKVIANPYMEVTPPLNGRYEFHSASMIDLIQEAYGFDFDKILGGPSWLEMDRFEVIAKVPPGTKETPPLGARPGTPSDAVKEMLQSLLADRLKLVVRQETKPLPGYALTVDRKPQMKEADGSGDTGCRYQPPADPADTFARFTCKNMSMEAFTAFLPRLIGGVAVIDKTELKGAWNFEMKWQRSASPQSAADEIAKQLGLKLEPQPIPTPVLTVVSASEIPTPNAPGVAEALPPTPEPTAFDVATIRPTDPDYKGPSTFGRKSSSLWDGRGAYLSTLLVRAFSPSFIERNDDLVVGMPGWAETARYDVTGRQPPGSSASARLAPMLLTLLQDRLQLKWHTEERPVSVFVLTSSKPKLKKADPSSRTHCLQSRAPAGSPPNAISMTCQNMTIEQFGDEIRRSLPGPGSPVLDATGLEGGWDFAFTYVYPRAVAQEAALSAVSDPDGGMTIVEALDRQLGLKLETQKRPMTVTVIDHIERTPVDN